MSDAVLPLLTEYQEIVVGAVVWLVMWLITRRWTNLQDAEVTKLKQALTAGLLAAVGIALANLAAGEAIAGGAIVGEAVTAWLLAMGFHAGGKRLKGALTGP